MQFSVITVTRNNLGGLRNTFESVAAQSFGDFEWIVMDGASEDGTQRWLATLDAGASLFVSEPDHGIFDAMNKGLERARGTYVIFMNAGDRFAGPSVLADVADHISRHGQADILYGDAMESDGPHLVRKRALPHRLVWYSMFTHHQAIFYRKAALGTRHYDLSFKLSADWALTAGLLIGGARARRLPLTVCDFERGGVSQSPASIKRAGQEYARIHREIIGVPVGIGAAVRAGKAGVNAVRRRMPWLYDVLRGRL